MYTIWYMPCSYAVTGMGFKSLEALVLRLQHVWSYICRLCWPGLAYPDRFFFFYIWTGPFPIYLFIIINIGQTELADSAQGTALSQIKTIHVVIYITIDKKSRLQLITKSLVRMM